MATIKPQEDVERSYQDFLQLIQATTGAGSSSSISSDHLATRLGIDGLPTKAQAIKLLEEEVLAPVGDLSGSDLSKWQM